MSAATRGKPLLSVREAAGRLGIGETTGYEWARRNELPGLVKLGGRLYVRAAVLDRFIAGADALTVPADELPAVRGLQHAREA